MIKRSEGFKRITFIASILFVIGWMVFIISLRNRYSINNDAVAAAFFITNAVVAFFIPQLIYRTVYWVIDGFNKDNNIKKG